MRNVLAMNCTPPPIKHIGGRRGEKGKVRKGGDVG